MRMILANHVPACCYPNTIRSFVSGTLVMVLNEEG